MKNKFEDGSTYKCRDCGKITREIGLDESSVELCAKCYTMANLENSVNDGIVTEEKYEELYSRLREAKTGKKIVAIFKELYTV